MKKIIFGIFGLLMITSFTVDAQKVGYCEIDGIIQIMPEYEIAKAKIEGEVEEMQLQAEEMDVELNVKYKAYTDNSALNEGDAGKWGPAILQVKEQELTQLQQRIQEFQMTSQGILEQRQYELLEPISLKLDSAINVVMNDKGYTYIIKDLTVIQVNKNKCDDISAEVKRVLGLQ